jgi:hypothetical protein
MVSPLGPITRISTNSSASAEAAPQPVGPAAAKSGVTSRRRSPSGTVTPEWFETKTARGWKPKLNADYKLRGIGMNTGGSERSGGTAQRKGERDLDANYQISNTFTAAGLIHNFHLWLGLAVKYRAHRQMRSSSAVPLND